MVNLSRKAIECILSAQPGGRIPSIGIHILNQVSRMEPRDLRSLDIASDYYQSIQELCDTGLVHGGLHGYCLTSKGQEILSRLKASPQEETEAFSDPAPVPR